MPVEYPNVQCDDHPGQIEPGYILCDHVKSLADVGYFEPANASTMGVICCPACAERKDDKDYTLDHFIVVCAPSMREQGLLVKVQ